MITREQRRKEMAYHEMNIQCALYDKKCGEVITYQATPEQLERYRKEAKKHGGKRDFNQIGNYQ